MKIILHKTRRTRPPNPVKAAVETADRSAVLINVAKTTVQKSEWKWNVFAGNEKRIIWKPPADH